MQEGARVSDPDDSERLRQLDARIAKLRGGTAKRPHQEEHYSQAQHAWRMVIELVAGLMIGFGMGYGLDSLFGTMPILLVVFTLLGFAAGIKTMMRSAAEMQAEQNAPARARTKGRRMATDAQGSESGLVFHPMDQFIVAPLFGDGAVGFFTPTNAMLWMALSVAAIFALLVLGTSRREIVPGGRNPWPSWPMISSTR